MACLAFVALVNSIGNLAGFGARSLIGRLRQLENGTTLTFFALSGFALMSSPRCCSFIAA